MAKKKLTNAEITAKGNQIIGTKKSKSRPKHVTVENGVIRFPLTGGANAILRLAEGYAYAAAQRPKQKNLKRMRNLMVQVWIAVTRDCQGGQTHSS